MLYVFLLLYFASGIEIRGKHQAALLSLKTLIEMLFYVNVIYYPPVSGEKCINCFSIINFF